jgi:hypothetical protein
MDASRGRFARIALTALALTSCSSNKATTPYDGPADASVDATTPAHPADAGSPPVDSGKTADSADPNPPATACTASPFVSFAATLSIVDLAGTTQALSGAKIGFTSCPGFYVTTDSTGAASTQLTQNVAVTPLFEDGTAIVGSIGAQLSATSDASLAVTVFASDVAPAIPAFLDAGSQATIAVVLAADPSATAPCNDTTGVTLAVTGHPEAVVSYAGTGWPSNPAVTTTSSTGTYVFINGVSGASSVVVTGAKSGCTVRLAAAPQTGTFALLSGSVTIGSATVSN